MGSQKEIPLAWLLVTNVFFSIIVHCKSVNSLTGYCKALEEVLGLDLGCTFLGVKCHLTYGGVHIPCGQARCERLGMAIPAFVCESSCLGQQGSFGGGCSQQPGDQGSSRSLPEFIWCVFPRSPLPAEGCAAGF